TDVFPAVLAYLGLDPDSKKPEDLEKATQQMLKVRPFIRKFHSSEDINALANGDACVAYGFSGDVKQAAKRAFDAGKGVKIEYAIPVEGAITWIDTWAIPKAAVNADAAPRFP